jgi:hypothetical protein
MSQKLRTLCARAVWAAEQVRARRMGESTEYVRILDSWRRWAFRPDHSTKTWRRA